MNGCISDLCKTELTKLQMEARDPEYKGNPDSEWVHCNIQDCHVFVHSKQFAQCESCDVLVD